MGDYKSRPDIEIDNEVVEEVREILRKGRRDLNFALAADLYKGLSSKDEPYSRPYIPSDITILF